MILFSVSLHVYPLLRTLNVCADRRETRYEFHATWGFLSGVLLKSLLSVISTQQFLKLLHLNIIWMPKPTVMKLGMYILYYCFIDLFT
jgi:hypothetical protein